MLLPTEPLGDPNRMKGRMRFFWDLFSNYLSFRCYKNIFYIKCCNVLPDFGPLWWGWGTVGEHIAPISLRGINLKRALVLQGPCKVLQGVPTENISKEK